MRKIGGDERKPSVINVNFHLFLIIFVGSSEESWSFDSRIVYNFERNKQK